MAGLKIFVALLFTYLFLRREGARRGRGLAASLACDVPDRLPLLLHASVMAFLPRGVRGVAP